MISHAFAALAHIRILVLPVGPIPRPTFEKHAAEIRTFDSIRLGDIPEGKLRDERARFMPNPLSSGYLFLSYPSHPIPHSHLPLSLFRPSHFTLGIIGIAACSSSYSTTSALEQFENAVLDIFPDGSTFPLAKVCFAFEDEESVESVGIGDTLSGIVSIPNMMGNKKLYIGTLLAHLCSQILAEFGRVYQILENTVGNEYLNSALFPTLPSRSEMPLSLSSYGSQRNLYSQSSQPELHSSGLAALNIPLKPTPTSGLGMSHISSLAQRQSTLGPPAVRKRVSTHSAVSSHGRLYKVQGDFYLLAGRTGEAMLWYAEAMVQFKSGHDPVWQASALEGMATVFVLDAWSVGQGISSVSNNGLKEPWADMYEQLSQAIALYHKAPVSSELSQDYSLLALTYCAAVMRQTSLLFCVWSTKGWGALAFASMLQPRSNSYVQKMTSDSSWANLERLSMVSGVSRAQIANAVSQAHGPWLLHLDPQERLATLRSMASIYSCIGYRRKEAFILREIISCIMDLIVCGREENDTLRKSEVGSANTGIHPANGNKLNTTRNGVGMRQNEIHKGNRSLLKLLIRACKVLGVDLDSVGMAKAADGSRTEVGCEDSPSTDELEDLTNVATEPFGWPELQVGVVREAIAVAEALPDPLAVARISLSALRTMHFVLNSSDQYHLYQTAGRALAVLRRRGDLSTVEYWTGHPITSVALLPLALHRLPIENSYSVLTAKSITTNSLVSGITDPFLYSRKSSGPQGKHLIVQGEPIELTITLRNPYVFDLEIQSISLSTTGVEFDCSPISAVVIPSNTCCSIVVIGIAKTRGTLIFRGCIVQAPWGAAKEFLLPVSTDAEESSLARRQSAVKCESGRTKYWGLDSHPWEKGTKRMSMLLPSLRKPPSQFLQCIVVPEQPLLRIRWTSLTHGAVMLYSGEESSIRMTLENVSALPVDFLRLSFEDSTIGPAQEALSEGDLSVLETYETEYDLLCRQAFSWCNDEITNICPNQKVVLSVTCLGKIGCTRGTIHISYSCVNRDAQEHPPTSDVLYTRQLSYPLTVTVYHMLECHHMSFMPMVDVEHDVGVGTTNSVARTLWEVDAPTEWCLFAIEVRNAYGLPFEVTFERKQAETKRATVSSTISPGSMSRIMLPIRKFRLSDDIISQPIPTLSDRQFVVGKSKLSIEEERVQRELFWYREELFKIISARWKETNSDRHGYLALRQQRLTLPMLKALRTDLVQADLTLVMDSPEDGSPQKLDHRGGKYVACPNTILYLRIEVANSTLSPLLLTLDLIVDPAEQVLLEGISSNVAIGKLASEETKAVELPFCFLHTGHFEIGAEVRILGSPKDSWAGASSISISVREDG